MIPYRDCIVFLLANAQKHAQATTRKHLSSLGLTPVQCLLLNALLEEEGLSVGEIGKRVGLDTATLAGVLDRMTSSDWLRRESDLSDGRVINIFLTEKARQATQEIYDAVEVSNEEILRDFSLEEKILFKRFLRDVRVSE
jgi:DNA-binding MarR family transcriptional regulator